MIGSGASRHRKPAKPSLISMARMEDVMSNHKQEKSTPTQPVRNVDTLVIGAGQAGLSAAQQLKERGGDCLVLEAGERIGDQWRHQYDTLRLYTTNRVNHLPGMKFPGEPRGFASKDELADFLEHYAASFELPVLCRARVSSLTGHGQRFVAQTAAGEIHAEQVVIATSPFGQLPAIPQLADELDEQILQLHSSEYRRPGQLKPGPVLVVGASHSGCDIAWEVAQRHPTMLSGRDTGEVPVPWGSPLIHLVVPLVMFAHTYLETRSTPFGRRKRLEVLEHGAPRLRVKRADLAARGVKWHEQRVTGVRNGQPVLADGTVLEVENVIWATGFRHDYSWLKLPVLDESGWPREYRGVAQDVPGLYFCGLAFQHSEASMNLFGVGRDAAYVARQIIPRASSPRKAADTERMIA
ncbi:MULTISPECIES: NAD(P)/FAD-dependent oxidoreductase [unclassified Arthrobacter]|uniref:flavin-containing monooxygenase n=1 Tax=unclassified Arthrobacter TaxID=235627 RepID=UPI0021583258|nr:MULTISPECIES: NAD(P)/FAD-dependent oxidoreductase [unclassified Arthrobacter]